MAEQKDGASGGAEEKKLLVRIIVVIAVAILVVAAVVSFLKMQEVPAVKVKVSVEGEYEHPQVKILEVKQEGVSIMSVRRGVPKVFPAVEMWVYVNYGMKGLDGDAKLYHGAGTYELQADELQAEFSKSALKDDDSILIIVRVVDEKGDIISNDAIYMKKWGELQ